MSSPLRPGAGTGVKVTDPFEDIDDLEANPDFCLSVLVRNAWLTLRASMDAALSTHGLSIAQYAALLALEARPGGSIADIARAASTTRQSANEMLTGMISEGLVERRSDSRDARRHQMHLTETGRERLHAARPTVHARERRLEADLPTDQRRAARAWLAHVATKDPSPG